MKNIFSNLETMVKAYNKKMVMDVLEMICKEKNKQWLNIWGSQSTMDYKYKIAPEKKDDIKGVAQILESVFSRLIDETQYNVLTQIKINGLQSDVEIVLKSDSNDKNQKLEHTLMKIIHELDQEKSPLSEFLTKQKIEIGGSPAISAINSYILCKNEKKVANTLYMGTYPKSVQENVENKINNFDLKPLFEKAVKNDHFPATLCVESEKYKLMISIQNGRNLKNLRNKNEDYVISSFDDEKYKMFCIGGLNKGTPKEYEEYIKQIKNKYPNALIYLGTNSFKKQIEKRNYQEIRAYYNILKTADIVSMNEAEIDQFHEAFKLSKTDDNRHVKLHELNFPKISIVHSADGAISCMGTAIDLNKKLEVKKVLLSGVLELAVDGATYLYEHGKPLVNLKEIIDYSKHIEENRNIFGFAQTYNHGTIPINSAYAISKSIKPENAKGVITGLGSVFDGYFAAIIAPLYNYFIDEMDV